MPLVPKFHLDESVTTAVADGLRLRNRDCTTTSQAGLMGAGDEEQLAFATGQSRVIITADQECPFRDPHLLSRPLNRQAAGFPTQETSDGEQAERPAA